MQLIAMFAIFMTVNILALLYLFFYLKRAEARRLAELTRIVQQIGDGNMVETAPEINDRFLSLACSINDMSANIQEVLILLWKQSSNSLKMINRLEGFLRLQKETDHDSISVILQECKDLGKSYDDCQELLVGFQFFGVNLENNGAWHHKPEKGINQLPETKN